MRGESDQLYLCGHCAGDYPVGDIAAVNRKADSYICAAIVLAIILSVTLPLSTEKLTDVTEYAAVVLAVLWCIPIARNTRYRLRDAGYTAKAYLWLLLPIVGWVIFVALLFAKSKHGDTGEEDQGIGSWYC